MDIFNTCHEQAYLLQVQCRDEASAMQAELGAAIAGVSPLWETLQEMEATPHRMQAGGRPAAVTPSPEASASEMVDLQETVRRLADREVALEKKVAAYEETAAEFCGVASPAPRVPLSPLHDAAGVSGGEASALLRDSLLDCFSAADFSGKGAVPRAELLSRIGGLPLSQEADGACFARGLRSLPEAATLEKVRYVKCLAQFIAAHQANRTQNWKPGPETPARLGQVSTQGPPTPLKTSPARVASV